VTPYLVLAAVLVLLATTIVSGTVITLVVLQLRRDLDAAHAELRGRLIVLADFLEREDAPPLADELELAGGPARQSVLDRAIGREMYRWN
jgi:hypothetical protein